MSKTHGRDLTRGDKDPKPHVGTDPEEEPEGGAEKHNVSLDKGKVREHEREKARRHESREEESERIKNA